MPKKRRIEEGVQALTVGGGVESACESLPVMTCECLGI